MRILLAVLSTSALATAAIAQQQPPVTPSVAPQGTIQAKAAIAECDRLISYLEQARPADAGVTVEQANAWRQTSNFEACRETLLRVSEAKSDSFSTHSNQPGTPGSASGPTGLPTVTSSGLPASPPAPSPSPPPPGPSAPPQALAAPPSGPGAASTPQVIVQQAQPSVTVRQRQPEIIVRMPPPTITVQQPNPEIIVRMPPPDVNVSVSRPEVQVSVPQPTVQVVPPQAQAQPQVRTDEQQSNVRLERTGEPRIVYQPAEGQPLVRFENAAGENVAQPTVSADPPASSTADAAPSATPGPASQTRAQAQLNNGQAGAGSGGPGAGGSAAPARPAGEPVQTGALPGEMRALKVSEIEDMGVYNGRGEKLGDVEKVLMGADNKPYFLVSHGGFLGLGSKQVAISSDQLALRGDRLVAEALTDEQVRGFPEFKESANFKEMDQDQTTSVRAVP
jgi:hypothetical protein